MIMIRRPSDERDCLALLSVTVKGNHLSLSLLSQKMYWDPVDIFKGMSYIIYENILICASPRLTFIQQGIA